MKSLIAALVVLVIGVSGAWAVEPDEILSNPAHEARAREMSRDLRCVVCQNQSIDDSNAELARDLRVLVRERITAGDTNEEVMDYVVSRYGDFVLLRPPFKAKTLVLWLGPLAIAFMGVIALIVFYRRRTADLVSLEPLNKTEERRLARLLNEKEGEA